MERRSGGRRFNRDDRGFRPRRNFDRNFDRGGSFEKPVKVGDRYDVEIQEVGSKGDGIARVKNFVVFVSNAQKGEKCTIEIKQVSNRFAIGEKVEGSASESTGEDEEDLMSEEEDLEEMEEDEDM